MTPTRSVSARLRRLWRHVCRIAGPLYLALITSSIALVLTLPFIP